MTRLVYILAASHSGSTLLSMLLNSHPQVATVGEIKLSPRAIGDISLYCCSCGELIRKCKFWAQVKEGMRRRGHEFDIAEAGTNYRSVDSSYVRRLLGPMHRGRVLEGFRDLALWFSPLWRKRLPEIHRRNAALVSTIAEISRAEIVADSSKTALRLKFLLRNSELDVKVIRLIRDGRGVALTYMDPAGFADATDPALRGGGAGGNRERERIPMAQAAYEWRRCNEEAENVLRGVDQSRWVKISYEDLCRNTDSTLKALFEFLGLDPAKRIPDFRTVEHHIVGNGMRLDTPSEIRLDERWRSVLTEEDLRIFDREGSRMKRRYGYE